MAELKMCLEELGLERVTTYIQSGNVIFASALPKTELTGLIEAALRSHFHYAATVVLRTRKQLRDIVERAPPGFGSRPAKYLCDVVFLKEPLTAAGVLKQVPTRAGVDDVQAGAGVLYFSRLASKASQSRLSRVVALPIYKSMTIRNWSTTTKLLELLNARDG